MHFHCHTVVEWGEVTLIFRHRTWRLCPTGQALVAHACNPSYSGGRDQEDQSLKAAPANSSWDPISKKTHHKKRAGGMAQGLGPEFTPSTTKK
jgi:hypothetical protein